MTPPLSPHLLETWAARLAAARLAYAQGRLETADEIVVDVIRQLRRAAGSAPGDGGR